MSWARGNDIKNEEDFYQKILGVKYNGGKKYLPADLNKPANRASGIAQGYALVDYYEGTCKREPDSFVANKCKTFDDLFTMIY